MIYGYDSQIAVATLILLVAMGTATWNTLIKVHKSPLTLVTLMLLPQLIIALPFAITHLPQQQVFYIIFISSLVQTLYITFLNSSLILPTRI